MKRTQKKSYETSAAHTKRSIGEKQNRMRERRKNVNSKIRIVRSAGKIYLTQRTFGKCEEGYRRTTPKKIIATVEFYYSLCDEGWLQERKKRLPQ